MSGHRWLALVVAAALAVASAIWGVAATSSLKREVQALRAEKDQLEDQVAALGEDLEAIHALAQEERVIRRFPLPVVLYAGSNGALLEEGDEAALYLWDYPQFAGLLAQALEGVGGKVLETRTMPIPEPSKVPIEVHLVYARYDPPVLCALDAVVVIEELALHSEGNDAPVRLFVKTPSGVWHGFETSIAAGRLEDYFWTVVRRAEAEAGEGP